MTATHARPITRPPERRPARDVRVWLFRVALVPLGGAVLSGPGGYTYLIAPVATLGPLAQDPAVELHRWHVVDIGAVVSLLAFVPLLAALRRPRERALLLQAGLGSITLLVLLTAGLPPHNLAAVVPSLLVVAITLAAYPPPRRALLRMSSERWRRDAAWVLAGVAPFLGWTLWANLSLQLTDLAGPHGSLGHWAGAAVLPAALLLLGGLAASGRQGWQTMSAILAVAYTYLGASALLLPDHDGSWGTTGAVLALAAAGAYALVVARSARRSRIQEQSDVR